MRRWLGTGPAVCPQCGMTYQIRELRRDWRGRMVCFRCQDERPTQDFVRPTLPRPVTCDAQPEPADFFIEGSACTLEARTAYPDYAIPDCAIPDWTPVVGTIQPPIPPVILEYPALVAAAGPRGHWRLGETSGTVAVDVLDAHHGTYFASPTLGVTGLIDGDADKACSFSGAAGQRVDINNTTSILLDTNFSLEAWFKTSTSGQNAFFVSSWRQSDSTGHGIGIYLNNIRAIYDGGGALDVNAPQIYDGLKHHVVATYTGSSPAIVVRLYLDGVLVGTSQSTYSVTNNSPFIRIAAAGDASLLYAGVIDEVVIYATVLTPAQVLAHYNSGL